MAIPSVNGGHRRSKAFLFLICCALAGSLPHCMKQPQSFFPALTLAFLLGIYAFRVVLRGRSNFKNLLTVSNDILEIDDDLPFVDVIVSARDEEAVVGKLVQRLAAMQYPKEKIQICIIDDGSQDKTSLILQELNKQFSNLKVISRSRKSGGGKSGALNQALKKVHGEWVFILDADADFNDEILLKLVPFAKEGRWAAVQLRKAVVNSQQNLLTCCQAMEMAMDTVIQQGRQSIGGVVELRGNGALLNRQALDKCGGFNEGTVTDDLDLSFRFLLSGGLIGILWDPPVYEEGVETLGPLMRQRKRWAEGGLQRFFDYWPLLISRRLNSAQHLDLTAFFLLQYVLPVISFFDVITFLITKTIPVYWPLSIVAFSISGLAFFSGCRRSSFGPKIPNPTPFHLIISIIYLSHWFFVIPLITIKMAFIPKKLVWVKTMHKGN
ncbi:MULTISPECIES: glycosyltransferase [Prochlorococcus]|uniref:Beta-monoglucosyldiacylglycerol synthase n=1 Tax=Prochlorococcus marinus (strain SARG / CCMP1375 / SS120) TaxID=167539 RepID=Q7V9L3_PROMA|nr:MULTISPECIES: glycosyltransferase family 2 protein [Prochlorococcus]AAQ00863.1 Glycosyltransferase [Prochlorococcus marinus subsp. marinus str. CCMP1375]KGG10642.1 Glycosyltransferase [Prochlorococcus marinus str. LG]KGG19892.1 Glycosyltransferase [Prochlorococcus marinus str. SS2]KGG23888.1 Glycosyltransferase [Prochlorococcus marinus str. SS35]KGG31852.1 Glycosyltransferase [Prochlorococcus marinus str. SS51]